MNLRIRAIFGGCLLALAVLIVPSSATAHVLITDNTGSIGAILHITPDDDPIAGESSNLFYGINSQAFASHSHEFSLEIVDELGDSRGVPINVKESTVSADYIFPARGVYTIELTANALGTKEHAHTFSHTQRVSRGLTGNVLDKPSYAWAEGLVIGSAVLFMVLSIVFFNKRNRITLYSKF